MNTNKLPEMCFSILPSTGEIVMLKRGERGYFPQREENAPWDAKNLDYLNENLGVTKAQMEAMKAGSMFGWDVPASNPDNYDNEGNWIK
jgi:hypothetical protein